MITVTGTLLSPANAAEIGSGELQLANFGAQIPTVPGAGEMARIRLPLIVGTDGKWAQPVTPNDQILPAGTYYTLSLQDADGNTSQINAYLFQGLPDGSTVDLSIFPPIDPTGLQPSAVTPPALVNLLHTVPASAAPVIDGSQFRTFTLPLAAGTPVSGMTFVNGVPGNLYVFAVTQPAVPVACAWATNMRNFAPVPQIGGATLIQSAFCQADGSLQAAGLGMLVPSL